MRKRYVVALLAGTALAATGGLVYADPFDTDSPDARSATAPGSVTVTLPTGDKIPMTPDGDIRASRVADLDYTIHLMSNGDRAVIPRDAVDDIRGGDLDARLFNVSALLRNGYTDAREVTSPESLGKPILDGKAAKSAKAPTEVTVKFMWRDGKPAEYGAVTWTNLKTGESDMMDTEKGKLVLKLPPGEYGFATQMDPNDGSARVHGVNDIKVGGTAKTYTVDGTKSKPVKYKVDAKDVADEINSIVQFNLSREGEGNIIEMQPTGKNRKLYGIPSKTKPQGHKAGFALKSELTGPADASKPYGYSLFGLFDDGIPKNPSFTAHNEDLATRTMKYDGMGAKAELSRGQQIEIPGIPSASIVEVASVKLPSDRTEYYSPAKDGAWTQYGFLDNPDADSGDTVVHMGQGLTAGSTGEVPWMSGPVTVGMYDTAWTGTSMTRVPWDKEEFELLTGAGMFDSGPAAEQIASDDVKGKAVLSKDGKEIASSDNGGIVGAQLAKDDKGRYKLELNAERRYVWTPFGTRSTATWGFDSAPVSEETRLGTSTVAFTAAGIRGGYAPGDKPQQVALEFVTQTGAEDRSCAALTFHVSYDDGKKWKKVSIKRDGDKATATLKHPKGATFVSVKFAAKDDKGQTVKTSTIRSYGLK